MITAISDVRVVLPHTITEPSTVVIDDGRIADITTGAAPDAARSGHGALLLPGLVDSHSDGLEKEIAPRQTVRFPLDYGLRSFEGRVRAAGITTICHGVSYQEKAKAGRSVERARETVAAIVERDREPAAGVSHRVLYRFEARDPEALTPLLEDLEASAHLGSTPMLSFEDHTPGQGQFRDLAQYEAAVDPTALTDGETPQSYVARLKAEGDALLATRHENRTRIAPLAHRGDIRLLAHDLETIDDVAEAAEAGATIAEFPLSMDVAKHAKATGMTTVMGAPNALRGHSHSGNTSARDLVAAGLCDVLASDYMPSAMLAAAFAMAGAGVCSLPDAVALITSGPATMIGEPERGRIAVGAIADLILVDDAGAWPVVLDVHRTTDHAARAGIGV
ncbi:MAG: alpha-D-ribose 1-methylphosphonate 5-triphosphate diphosphatase [Actinomycetota bacterium]